MLHAIWLTFPFPMQENRRLVRRLYHVQRLVSRTRQQCRLVASRLDSHGDDYRQAALRAPTATEDGQVPETKLPREVPEVSVRGFGLFTLSVVECGIEPSTLSNSLMR